ncbi:TPM domain-containing protein [Sphingobium subterraneum]|uniref:Putative membrane protein n=1 Tax=Sphingobium subterraneum TaxID=627688 RepID=A0A841J2E7_9SPHN|nr:TPM domain-containing protein [Sphingobium subterraneum]MBB6122708.1 putative membrane protein [Sphingobium subterraneum]
MAQRHTLDLSPDDHARIAAAVGLAERRSDGEIVTVIAPRSDAYHDVGLHYAVAAMALFLAAVAAWPLAFAATADSLLGGWDHHLSLRAHLTVLLGVIIALFLVVRYALAWMPLRMALTPSATKERRVRRQAIAIFRAAAQGRTRRRTGILLYLSLAEHRAEIVADEAITAQVAPERWGDAMAALIRHLRAGDPATGIIQAVEAIGAILTEHLPPGTDNPNELPDGLIEL